MVVPRLGFSFEFAVVEQISNRKPAAFRSTKTGSCLARTRWTIRNLDAREIGHLRFHVAEPAVGVVLNGVLIIFFLLFFSFHREEVSAQLTAPGHGVELFRTL